MILARDEGAWIPVPVQVLRDGPDEHNTEMLVPNEINGKLKVAPEIWDGGSDGIVWIANLDKLDAELESGTAVGFVQKAAIQTRVLWRVRRSRHRRMESFRKEQRM